MLHQVASMHVEMVVPPSGAGTTWTWATRWVKRAKRASAPLSMATAGTMVMMPCEMRRSRQLMDLHKVTCPPLQLGTACSLYVLPPANEK